MQDAFRRRFDKLDREKVHFTGNADFPAGSPADAITVEINAKMDEAMQLDADLVTAAGDNYRRKL